jgi:Siphovirus Gp157
VMSSRSMIANLTDPAVVQPDDGIFSISHRPGETEQFESSVQQAGEDTVRLAPEILAAARPLYDIEAHLAALVDTEEMVPKELEAAYAQELQTTLHATVDMRDRVGQFILHLKSQVAFSHAEASRLEQRERFFEKALARMEAYVTRTIDSLGRDAKGKRKKLDGNVITLSLHGCDKRVEVTDEAAVPTRYKRVTVTLPAETWELVCDSLDLDLRDQVLGEVKSAKVEVSTSLVKSDLKAEITVAGAKLAGGTYVVVK